MRKTKKEIFIFFVLLIIFSGLSYVLISVSNVPKAEDSSAALLLVYSPFLAALITRLITDRNIKKLGKVKYLFLAIFIPITYGIIIYGFAWLTKIGVINEHIIN